MADDPIVQTKFGDIKFPGESHKVDLAYRHHVHVYPHSPGGAPEKLGRDPYRVNVRGNFQSTFAAYPDLYPNGMNRLRTYAELGTTLTFTHPTMGSFPAFIVRWSQVRESKTLSGEKVDIEFLEDQSAQFALNDLAPTADHSAIDMSNLQLAQDLVAVQADLALQQNTMDVFTALQSAVNDLLAVKDTQNLYGNLFVSRVQQVIGLCQQLDSSLDLQDPRAWPLVSDIEAVWLNAIRIANDLQQQQASLAEWVVPFTMPVITIALSLYGDASRQQDLLALNADRIDDATRVLAGTEIRYYPLTVQQTIAAQAA